MRQEIRLAYRFLLAVVFVSLLGACAPASRELSGDEKASVLVFSEEKTDNLLAGLSSDDYATFSRDFDAEMLRAMTPDQFEALKKDREARLGSYLSRKVASVLRSGEFYTVIYDASFEKDDHVAMRVVFRVDDPHQISGLWFNK
jgi:hypothetical protein